jgi:hypothetical protein
MPDLWQSKFLCNLTEFNPIQYQIIAVAEAVVQSCESFLTTLLPRNSLAFQGHCATVAHFRLTDAYCSVNTMLIPHSLHIISNIDSLNSSNSDFRLEWLVFECESELESITSPIFQKFSIKYIFIPRSVSLIGTSAVTGGRSAAFLHFDRNSLLIQLQANIFFRLERLLSIVIPASVRQIFHGTFGSCNGLRSVTFESPSQCRYIASGAFCNCGLLKDDCLLYINGRKLIQYFRNFMFEWCDLSSRRGKFQREPRPENYCF